MSLIHIHVLALNKVVRFVNEYRYMYVDSEAYWKHHVLSFFFLI